MTESYTPEERALWDALATRWIAEGAPAENAYDRTKGAFLDTLKARRALFGAPEASDDLCEPPKLVKCANCGESKVVVKCANCDRDRTFEEEPAQPDPAKVKLPKVRNGVEILLSKCKPGHRMHVNHYEGMLREMLAEIDAFEKAAEGR